MAAEKKDMNSLPLFTVDAFASKPFTGNPAAVCLLQNGDLSDDTKQKIAMEMNLSETAFVRLLDAGDSFEKSSCFELSWFTPKNEVNLCGHATVASAAVIFMCSGNKSQSLTFKTKSGELTAVRTGDQITISLPQNPPTDKIPKGIDKLIEITLDSDSPCDVQYTPGANKELLLRVPDSYTREKFEGIAPNPAAMMGAYKTGEVMGVIITLKGSQENGAVDENGRVFDFISRYFAPWNGINEDPVTGGVCKSLTTAEVSGSASRDECSGLMSSAGVVSGAAHTVLSPYWSKILGKEEMYARQCSLRGGNLKVKIRDDGRVDLSGTAKVVLEGKLFLN